MYFIDKVALPNSKKYMRIKNMEAKFKKKKKKEQVIWIWTQVYVFQKSKLLNHTMLSLWGGEKNNLRVLF